MTLQDLYLHCESDEGNLERAIMLKNRASAYMIIIEMFIIVISGDAAGSAGLQDSKMRARKALQLARTELPQLPALPL